MKSPMEMKPVMQTKKLLENRIVQSVLTIAVIGILSWSLAAYNAVDALPDALDSLDKKIEEVVEDQQEKDTRDSTYIIKEIEDLEEASEEAEGDIRALEDKQIEYNVKQDLMIEILKEIKGKLDED